MLKKKRNSKLKEKRKSWEYKYKQALKRWEKLLPQKIHSWFLPVSQKNPFFWSVSDRHLKEDIFTKSEQETFRNFIFPNLKLFMQQFNNRLDTLDAL